MTRKTVVETCEIIGQSAAADLVTKRKANALQRLMQWDLGGVLAEDDAFFDTLEKLGDGAFLVKVTQGSTVTAVRYGILRPPQQEQLKLVWSSWKELSPVAEKIRSGSMPIVDTAKAKRIETDKYKQDCLFISGNGKMSEDLTDESTRSKARELSEQMKLCGRYEHASLGSLIRNNDGTAWVELDQRIEDETHVGFIKSMLVKYSDLDVDSQKRFRETLDESREDGLCCCAYPCWPGMAGRTGEESCGGEKARLRFIVTDY